MVVQQEVLGDRSLLIECGDIADQVLGFEADHFGVEFAGFQFRIIQYVIENVEQYPAGTFEDVGIARLFRIQFGIAQ